MPKLMTRCETKKLFKIDGKKEHRWVDVAVEDVTSESTIRCAYCHGAIKINPAKATGAGAGEAHFTHKSRADADSCQNGSAQGRSSKPVV
jgi:hypothetical protein